MIEMVAVNGAILSVAQQRWMRRLAQGNMSIAEAVEKIELLPRNREGCNVLLGWLSNVRDSYGYEVLVDDYWELLTEKEKRMVVQKVRFLFIEEIWRDILWRLNRDERKRYLEDL
jgi:hypothetical protein